MGQGQGLSTIPSWVPKRYLHAGRLQEKTFFAIYLKCILFLRRSHTCPVSLLVDVALGSLEKGMSGTTKHSLILYSIRC